MNWMEVRENNIEIFEDTRKFYNYDETIKERTEELKKLTQVYTDPVMEIGISNVPNNNYDTEVAFTDRGTVTATYDYASAGYHVAALNFADALIPGGYVLEGACTQEENICRCSNLYASLTTQEPLKEYYKYNNDMLKEQPYYTDALIYSPDVAIFKDDVTYEYKDVMFADIITCPSAATRDAVGFSTEELRGVLTYRLEGIIKSAVKNRAEVLVLGAWGCGAFGQDTAVMAEIFSSVLSHYKGYFKIIEFAIRSHTNKKEIFETVFALDNSNNRRNTL